MKLCPQCKAEVVGNSSNCVRCGLDLSLEFESTRLSSDDRSREPTEVMAPGIQTQSSGSFSPGTVLAGRYRLITPIGKGGMGEVYKADDLELNQTVALKFLPASVAKDEAALKRFRSEVRTARQVSHPNVCRVFDIAEAEGVYFITMEYVEGDDLSILLRRIGRLPSDKAVEIARQLCLGLHAIHDAGILHRDLKPANIIIDSRGKARITDFGIAGVESELTRDDFRSGTPGYMSPEQFDGQSVTQKSDIYSLGLLLYEIFTGKQAIQFESLPELIQKHQTTTPTNPSEILEDIDPMVEKTILRCLEKDPDDRPANALQVALMLPGGNPLEAAIAAGETPSPEMVAAAPKKGVLSIGVAGAAFAGVVLLFMAYTFFFNDRHRVTVIGEKSGEVLAARSREIAANLGYTEPPHASAYAHAFDPGFMIYAIYNPDQIADPVEIVKSGWSRNRYFRYRQSPSPLSPRALIWVRRDDPPFDVPGMVRVLTDATGRLTALEAVPIPRTGSAGEKNEVNWGRLFTEAGLDLSRFTPVAPELIPIVYAEEHLAWTGHLPIDPNIEIRVEAAAYNGRPVFFRIAAPWDDPADPNQYSGRGPPTAIAILIPSVIILVFVGLIVLSWHNYRNKRTDLRGSLRVLAGVFMIGTVGRLVTADHTSSVLGEIWLLSNLFSAVLFYAVIIALIYSALEPHIRRSWPEALISWSRLLSGDIRSPMIGRDVVFGMLLGILTAVLMEGLFVLASEPITQIPHTNTYGSDRIYWAAADLLNVASIALLVTFMIFFVVFVFQLVFRRRWLALAVLGSVNVLVAATSLRPGSEFGPYWYIAFVGGLLGLTHYFTLWITITRFGVIGLISYIFAVAVTGPFSWPFTFNRGDIYFAISTFTLMLFTAIAGYASYLATGGRTPEIAKILEGSAE